MLGLVLQPLTLFLHAQNISVYGTVKDAAGETVIGANVSVKGTTNGTITDIDGNYSISNVLPSATLVFSYIGMETKEIHVNNQTVIHVVLVEDTHSLEEIVVIGYGSVRKKDLTGSVSSVKGKDLHAFSTATPTQALQGRSAGVQVLQNSGAPGATMQVRIRGTNSIRGSNEPLWIIDGFPGDQNMLNNGDIESMEVLKDASATAIYGSRGANGVIIITTKRGRAGATRVDYEGSLGIQSVRKKLDLLDAGEYMQLMNIQQLNDTGKEYFSPEDIARAGKGYDWQDMLYRNASIHDHTLTVSGGSEKTQFSTSFTAFDQEGIMLNNNYRRLSLRANLDHKISKYFQLSVNTILSRSDTKNSWATVSYSGRGASIISAIPSAPPTSGAYTEDGDYLQLKTLYPFISDGLINPIAYTNEKDIKNFNNRVLANIALTITPIEDLSLKVAGNITNTDYRSDQYTTLKYPGSTGSASIESSNRVHLNGELLANYTKTFNDDHYIGITLAGTMESNVYKNVRASGSGFLSDIYGTFNIGSASTIETPSSSYSKWTLLSGLGRINYSFKGKYLLTVSMRADGSSRYSEGDKWGYFPSGALAYRISEEEFMSNLDFLSDLKLRMGYGSSGSTAIDPYYTLDMLSTSKVVFNDDLYTAFAPGTRLPEKLKWETTDQINIGLDASFFDHRLRLTLDYYKKNTKDLLNNVQLARSSGYSTTIRNIGEIRNRGVEFQVDANPFNGDFKWDISMNTSFNKNEVVKLYNGQDILGTRYDLSIMQDYINLIREGQPLGVFYGYVTNGYDENGKITYKDLNDDNKITTDDRTYIGDPNPDFIYGINSNMSWKNFEFSFFIQGTQGNDLYSLTMASQTLDFGQGLNTLREVLYDHWTPENTNAKYPYITRNTTVLYSDRFVYNASYLRLKNIQLGYNIPFHKLGIPWIKRGFIYVSGQNLLTITSYPWQDPEINAFGGSASVNQGIDQYSYPVAKSVTFGAKFSF
jgi:TonB-linked SusC/RagA family outer membrane protein